MSNCSICLNPNRTTRSTSILPCGHSYHKKCIDDWESRGNETCPLCRSNIAKTEYRITLTIENLMKNRNAVFNLTLSDIQGLVERLGIPSDELDMTTTDVVFDIDDLENLQSIISDFGIRLADIDPAVLNAE